MAPSCLLRHTIGVTALSSAKASANLRVILILAKRRTVFLRFLGKRGWLAAESSAVVGYPAA